MAAGQSPSRRSAILNFTGTQLQTGTLYLVATPIGNLEDITIRAIRILRDVVSTIACEDTRQTQKLLQHFEIRKPLLSYHEHNEAARTEQILLLLARGESVAIVSDAGTPLISDPGYRVVHAAIDQGLPVVPIPGPAACITALVASGLPSEQFRYLGFLPPKSHGRRMILEALREEQMTVVAYESPHRILDCLQDVADLFPRRAVVVARELTKVHEEFLRGTAANIHQVLGARPAIKGEFTVVIAPATGGDEVSGDPRVEVLELEAAGMSRMEAIKTAAKKMGLPKREVYRLLAADARPEPGNSSADKNHD